MKRCLVVAAALGLAGWLLFSAGRGQSPLNALTQQPGGVGGGAGFGAPYGLPGGSVANPAAGRTRPETSKLVAELRDATEEAKKTEITKKLETAVTKFFDEDQKAREAELTKLEERLKKLRAQLDRRSKAKADIIQLQLKVLVNEAEGLGFSGTSVPEAGASQFLAYPVFPGAANANPLTPAAIPAPARAP